MAGCQLSAENHNNLIMSEQNSYSTLTLAYDGALAVITLNRPEKRNALDAELISEIRDAMRSSARDENVRVVLIAGAGADFCSGADLSGLERTFNAGVLDHMADARNMAELFVEMRHHPRPIVAAVRGRALAGGSSKPLLSESDGFCAEATPNAAIRTIAAVINFLASIMISPPCGQCLQSGFESIRHGVNPAATISRSLELVA